jgi:hypothetical protein
MAGAERLDVLLLDGWQTRRIARLLDTGSGPYFEHDPDFLDERIELAPRTLPTCSTRCVGRPATSPRWLTLRLAAFKVLARNRDDCARHISFLVSSAGASRNPGVAGLERLGRGAG